MTGFQLQARSCPSATRSHPGCRRKAQWVAALGDTRPPRSQGCYCGWLFSSSSPAKLFSSSQHSLAGQAQPDRWEPGKVNPSGQWG